MKKSYIFPKLEKANKKSDILHALQISFISGFNGRVIIYLSLFVFTYPPCCLSPPFPSLLTKEHIYLHSEDTKLDLVPLSPEPFGLGVWTSTQTELAMTNEQQLWLSDQTVT